MGVQIRDLQTETPLPPPRLKKRRSGKPGSFGTFSETDSGRCRAGLPTEARDGGGESQGRGPAPRGGRTAGAARAGSEAALSLRPPGPGRLRAGPQADAAPKPPRGRPSRLCPGGGGGGSAPRAARGRGGPHLRPGGAAPSRAQGRSLGRPAARSVPGERACAVGPRKPAPPPRPASAGRPAGGRGQRTRRGSAAPATAPARRA